MSRSISARMLAIALAGVIFAPVTADAQTIWHVDDDAPPGGDGATWTTAFTFLQDALAAARPGHEVHVGQGTYRPDRDAANPGGTGAREATFQLVSGVALRGGYAGYGQPDPEERDVDAYPTTLSGDLAGDDDPNDFPLGPSCSDNSVHVVTGTGADATAVLDGFTITAGSASGCPVEWGGGMYNDGGSPTLIRCRFARNAAAENGGGLCALGCDMMIVDCTFSDNFTGHWDGGGMYIHRGAAMLTGCRFVGNIAQIGGGIATSIGDVTLVNCLFAANKGPI